MLTPYISRDQPVVFLGNYWLDDLQSIHFQYSNPKEALYGFADTEYRSVARGQSIVHGMLDLNFRFRGYLMLVLGTLFQQEHPSGEDFSTESPAIRERMRGRGNDFQNAGLDPATFTAEQFKTLLETPHQEFDIPGFTRISRSLQETFWGTSAILTPPERIAQQQKTWIGHWREPHLPPRGFDLMLVYASPDGYDPSQELNPSLVRHIRGVHIVNESTVIENDVPGGGEPLIERYQFIARSID